MLFCVVHITLSSTMSDTSSTSIGSAVVGGGRASEGVRSISGPVVAEVAGVAPSDEVVRSVTPSSTSQFDVIEERMLDTLSPLGAAVNSRALGLYLCPPLPRTKEKRSASKKVGESKLSIILIRLGISNAIVHRDWGQTTNTCFCVCLL